MNIIRGIRHIPSDYTGCVATIGNFDGVHKGHQQVLTHLKQQAKIQQLPATVISFDPLPHEFFGGDKAAPRIYPLRDKVRLLQALGIDDFIQFNFNQAFSHIEAETFVLDILLKKLKVRYLVVGDDFCFGKMRRGNFKLLQQLGKAHDMIVQDTKTVTASQQRISSSRIRTELQKANLATANQLLGFPYQLSGRIRRGDQLGRTLGFPTINLRLPENIALRAGIYAVSIKGLETQQADKIYYGAASVGKRPTVDGIDMRLETYIFDFDQQVYGQYICVELLSFIRPEEKFASLEIMQTQIHQDCELIQTFIHNNH
jgi:riboflavin kinase/FMN adenylyltransferase